MQINITKGVRRIKLTKGEAETIRRAQSLIAELALATGGDDLDDTAAAVGGIVKRIAADGVFA